MSVLMLILLVCAGILALCGLFSLLGFFFGVFADIVALLLKVAPIVLVIIVIAYFAKGGKVTRTYDGNITLELPESWRKRD
jgi:hypothetical protein